LPIFVIVGRARRAGPSRRPGAPSLVGLGSDLGLLQGCHAVGQRRERASVCLGIHLGGSSVRPGGLLSIQGGLQPRDLAHGQRGDACIGQRARRNVGSCVLMAVGGLAPQGGLYGVQGGTGLGDGTDQRVVVLHVRGVANSLLIGQGYVPISHSTDSFLGGGRRY